MSKLKEFKVVIKWTVDDVVHLFDITREEASNWLQKNSRRIEDHSIDSGWELLESLGEEDGLPRTDNEIGMW